MIILLLPTWSILKFVALPEAVEAVVELPIIFPSPSCNTSNTKEAPACVTYILFVAIADKLIRNIIKKVNNLKITLLVSPKLDVVHWATKILI